MDLMLKSLGFRLYFWDECVKEYDFTLNRYKILEECVLKTNEPAFLLQLKSLNELTDEHFNKIFQMKNLCSPNFIEIICIVIGDKNTYYFCYNRSDATLLEYLCTTRLDTQMKLLIFKQAVEILYYLVSLNESFSYFDSSYFFIKTFSFMGFPILQFLYHGIFIYNFTNKLADFLPREKVLQAKTRYSSSNWCHWLYYFQMIIFKDYFNEQPEYPKDIQLLFDYIFKTVSTNSVFNLNIEHFIMYFNFVLKQCGLEEISMNQKESSDVSKNCSGVNVNNLNNLNNYKFNFLNSSMCQNNCYPCMNNNPYMDCTLTQPPHSKEYLNIVYPVLQNNNSFYMKQPRTNEPNENFINGLHVNNNFNNPQINYHQYFQFFQNEYNGNKLSSSGSPYYDNACDQNMLMQFYMNNKKLFPMLNAIDNKQPNMSNSTRKIQQQQQPPSANNHNSSFGEEFGSIFNDKTHSLTQFNSLIQVPPVETEIVTWLPSENSAKIQKKTLGNEVKEINIFVDKNILSCSLKDYIQNDNEKIKIKITHTDTQAINNDASANDSKSSKSHSLINIKRQRTNDKDKLSEKAIQAMKEYDLISRQCYYFPEIFSKTILNFKGVDQEQMKMIQNIDNPKRRKNKGTVTAEKDFFNGGTASVLKTELEKYFPKYEEDLKACLEEKRHVFMKEHFPSMYNLENFFLHITLPKEKRATRANYYDISQMEADKQCQGQEAKCKPYIKKIWDKNKLREDEVETYLVNAQKNWPVEKCMWNEEYAFEYLIANNYSIEDSTRNIVTTSPDFEQFLSDKTAKAEQMKKQEMIEKQWRRIRYNKLKRKLKI